MKEYTRDEYEALCDEVWHHNRLYFQEMKPEISDDAFDQLVKEVEGIESAHPDWISDTSPTKRIGEKPLAGFKDVPHTIAMLSLEKAFTKKELEDFHKRILKLLEKDETSYTAELKLDGLAISVCYEKGRLVKAVTRGDGKVGSDVTQNIKTLSCLPLRLDPDAVPDYFEVRGEVFIPKKAFEQMNAEREKEGLSLWANARNAAAGSLKLLDPKEVAKRSELTVVFYGIVGSDPKIPKSQHALYSYLAKLGLQTLNTYLPQNQKGIKLVANPDEILQFADYIASIRQDLPFAIDGIVIKLDSLEDFENLGSTGKHPRAAIAYKFSSEEAWTYVEAITVQVGRTGAITPVAELQPTKLAGSTISRATLHNFEELERKDIRVNDYVAIEKGGDVIPKVVAVDRHKRDANSQPFVVPTTCPSCDATLVKDPKEVVIRCPNTLGCPDQRARSLIHFASKNGLDIEHLGEKVMLKLVENGFVKEYSDIFRLTKEQVSMIEGFKEKSVNNLLESIEKAKKTTLEKFIMALGIRYVGSQTAQTIASYAKSLEKILSMTKEDFLSFQGVGEKVAESLYEYFQDPENRKTLSEMKELGVEFEDTEKAFDTTHLLYNKTVVLTGSLSIARHVATGLVKKVGGRCADSVSKKVDYLVVGKDAGSKLEKAKKLGIEIMPEDTFLQLFSH